MFYIFHYIEPTLNTHKVKFLDLLKKVPQNV